MALSSADRLRFRENHHAYAASAHVRARDILAATVLTAARDAADALLAAANAVDAELADDHAVRRDRDAAATELRSAVLGALRRYRLTVEAEAIGDDGSVVDAAAIARVDDLVRQFLPDGTPSSLPEGGPALQAVATNVRGALAPALGTSPALARIDAALTRHAEMAAAITREAQELVEVRARLDAARELVDRSRRAGWHYVNYLAAAQPELGIDPRAIYPASAASRRTDAGQALAVLDEAGAVDTPADGVDGVGVGTIAEA